MLAALIFTYMFESGLPHVFLSIIIVLCTLHGPEPRARSHRRGEPIRAIPRRRIGGGLTNATLVWRDMDRLMEIARKCRWGRRHNASLRRFVENDRERPDEAFCDHREL